MARPTKAWVSRDRFGYYLSLTKPRYAEYHGCLDFRGLKVDLCGHERRGKPFPGFGFLHQCSCVRVEISAIGDMVDLVPRDDDEE